MVSKAVTKPAAKVATKPATKAAPAVKAAKPVARATAKPASAKASPVKAIASKSVSVKAPVAVVVEKPKKSKLVRDSFTMPEAEYAVLGHVKKACLKAGIEVKKSQLLRIGLALLKNTDVPNLKKMIAALEPLKAGRPKKEK
ncbi:MAG: hypothetical protein KGM99_16070 [Burkholderiales bacterium]|nr:hypothetical protein [Burkholderiales bacterium]